MNTCQLTGWHYVSRFRIYIFFVSSSLASSVSSCTQTLPYCPIVWCWGVGIVTDQIPQRNVEKIVNSIILLGITFVYFKAVNHLHQKRSSISNICFQCRGLNCVQGVKLRANLWFPVPNRPSQLPPVFDDCFYLPPTRVSSHALTYFIQSSHKADSREMKRWHILNLSHSIYAVDNNQCLYNRSWTNVLRNHYSLTKCCTAHSCHVL